MAPESFQNENIARDHSHVGMQVGQQNGNVINAIAVDRVRNDADVQEQLAVIRADLKAARERQEVDTATFIAAEQEVSSAETHLAGQGPEARSQLLVALRRLKGLLEGVADLASKVAAIINAVHTLR